MEEKRVKLYRSSGKVHTIADFVEKNKHLLSKFEQQSLEKGRAFLRDNVPKGLEVPVSRNIELGGKVEVEVDASGVRSAYDPDRRIKFKGCNPHPELGLYRNLMNHWGAEVPVVESEKWGVMEEGAVMREILGMNRMHQKGLPTVLEPMCVHEYEKDGESLGFCLAQRSEYNIRLDDLGDDSMFLALSLFNQPLLRKLLPIEKHWISDEDIKHDIALIAKAEKMSVDDFTKREIGRLEQLYDKPIRQYENIDEIVDRHTDMFIGCHFNGIFRYSVNCANDNTIVSPSWNMYPCDFDTTRLVEIPSNPDEKFMKDFYLACIAEIHESDFNYYSFIDHDDVSETRENALDILDKVNKKYKEISDHRNSYFRKFMDKTKELGWNQNRLNKVIGEAEVTHIYFDSVLRRVRNSYLNANFPMSGLDRDKYKGDN